MPTWASLSGKWQTCGDTQANVVREVKGRCTLDGRNKVHTSESNTSHWVDEGGCHKWFVGICCLCSWISLVGACARTLGESIALTADQSTLCPQWFVFCWWFTFSIMA